MSIALDDSWDQEKWEEFEAQNGLYLDEDEPVANIPIEYHKGSVLNAPQEFSLVHCVAADMIMSKGVAKAFRDRFGRRDELRAQKRSPGQVAFFRDEDRYILCLIGKPKTNSIPVKAGVLLKCLKALQDLCRQLNITKLAMPQLGRGYNQVEWDTIEPHINKLFGLNGIKVHVYRLH